MPREQIRRRHRVLDSQINSYATRRRHGMRSIADQEQARKMPFPQPVDLHREQLDLLPTLELVHPISQIRRDAPNRLAKCVDAFMLGLFERTLRNNQPGLEVIAAIDQDQHSSVV